MRGKLEEMRGNDQKMRGKRGNMEKTFKLNL